MSVIIRVPDRFELMPTAENKIADLPDIEVIPVANPGGVSGPTPHVIRVGCTVTGPAPNAEALGTAYPDRAFDPPRVLDNRLPVHPADEVKLFEPLLTGSQFMLTVIVNYLLPGVGEKKVSAQCRLVPPGAPQLAVPTPPTPTLLDPDLLIEPIEARLTEDGVAMRLTLKARNIPTGHTPTVEFTPTDHLPAEIRDVLQRDLQRGLPWAVRSVGDAEQVYQAELMLHLTATQRQHLLSLVALPIAARARVGQTTSNRRSVRIKGSLPQGARAERNDGAERTIIDFLIRYCWPLRATGKKAVQFYDIYQRHQQAAVSQGGSSGSTRLTDWLQGYRDLYTALRVRREAVEQLKELLTLLHDRLLVSWDAALHRRVLWLFQRRVARVVLTATEQEAFLALLEHDGESVPSSASRVATMRDQRLQDFAQGFQAFQTALRQFSWVNPLIKLAQAARREWLALRNRTRYWLSASAGHISQINEYLRWLRERVFASDAGARRPADSVTLRLSRSLRGEYQDRTARATTSVNWFRENWCAPIECAEAVFALRSLERIDPQFSARTTRRQ